MEKFCHLNIGCESADINVNHYKYVLIYCFGVILAQTQRIILFSVAVSFVLLQCYSSNKSIYEIFVMHGATINNKQLLQIKFCEEQG